MIFCARATRGLRRPSLDARSGRLIRTILEETSTSKLGRTIVICSLRPCLGQGASWRARVGRVRNLACLSILPSVLLLPKRADQ